MWKLHHKDDEDGDGDDDAVAVIREECGDGCEGGGCWERAWGRGGGVGNENIEEEAKKKTKQEGQLLKQFIFTIQIGLFAVISLA